MDENINLTVDEMEDSPVVDTSSSPVPFKILKGDRKSFKALEDAGSYNEGTMYYCIDTGELFIAQKDDAQTQTQIKEIGRVGKDFAINSDGVIVASSNFSDAHGEIFNNYENNKASGEYSHAEGNNTTAAGNYSHAEGKGDGIVVAITGEPSATTYTYDANDANEFNIGMIVYYNGIYAKIIRKNIPTHTITLDKTLSSEETGVINVTLERNIAYGASSHTEGNNTAALGDYSHTEGDATKASGTASHAEGAYTTASGTTSHAEGSNTTASGINSHAEGSNTTASRTNSHAEGNNTTASGTNSHAEGSGTTASGTNQHVQGKYNISDTTSAHIVGNGTSTSNRKNAHTLDWEGNAWFAGDVYVDGTGQDDANAVKLQREITGIKGEKIVGFNEEGFIAAQDAIGRAGTGSGAEVFNGYATNEASGSYSHAEGLGTTASGGYSHAEGAGTTASGFGSHTEGMRTIASSNYSHAEGYGTTANSKSQHVQGEFNMLDTEKKTSRGTYAHIVGNGTSNSNRKNAHTLDWQGNAWFAGDVYVSQENGDKDTNKTEDNRLLTSSEVDSKISVVDNRITTEVNTINESINGNVSNLNAKIDKKVQTINQSIGTNVNTLNTSINNLDTKIDTTATNMQSSFDTAVGNMNTTLSNHNIAADAHADIRTAITDVAAGLNTKIDTKRDKLIVAAVSTDGVNYTATIDGLTTLEVGMEITIIPNMNGTVRDISLNINGLGNYSIFFATYTNYYIHNENINWLHANHPLRLMWNGYAWVTDITIAPTETWTFTLENGNTTTTITKKLVVIG